MLAKVTLVGAGGVSVMKKIIVNSTLLNYASYCTFKLVSVFLKFHVSVKNFSLYLLGGSTQSGSWSCGEVGG